jgi:RNA polymerase sigma-70 factor, ECF subfamily
MSSLFNRTKDEEFNALEHFKDEKADVLTSFQQGEISEAVNEALRCIPEHQREVFVLRRFQDLSYEEISEVTGVPVGTAKSRVARAEKALRPLLDNFREYL